MNPTDNPIARIPEPFSEPQTIPAGWDVSAFDNGEKKSGAHKGKKDKDTKTSPTASKQRNDIATDTV